MAAHLCLDAPLRRTLAPSWRALGGLACLRREWPHSGPLWPRLGILSVAEISLFRRMDSTLVVLPPKIAVDECEFGHSKAQGGDELGHSIRHVNIDKLEPLECAASIGEIGASLAGDVS